MTPERWHRVEGLYHAALEREPARRPAYLDEACVGDLELRQEVESLLAAHDSRDAFLEIPAAAVAAEALAEARDILQPQVPAGYNDPQRAMSASPSKIGRYAVRRRLGGGGMGIVYLAHDPVIDRQVAVKVLRTALDDGDMRERFAREARSTGSLFHRNIVTVFDAGEHEGQPFIAMEFVDGRSVDELVRRRELLTLERRLRLIEDLCAGLSYAHGRGIVHRDIKPANLMLASDGVLKVLDFGIARLVDAGVSRVTAVGTPSYMSPEQVWGARVDHRSDIFAVGLVLYEVLAYARAFPGDTLPRICHAIVSEEPRPLVEFVPDLDPEVIGLVALALKKNPDERCQDVAVLGAKLAAARSRLMGLALQSLPSVLAGPIANAPSPRSPKRRTDPAELAERRARRVDEACATAEAKLAAGEYDDAIAAAEEALVVDPTALRAIRLVEGARAKLDDHRARAYLSEAVAHVEAGALTKAEALVREAATLAPGAPELHALQQRIAAERRDRAEVEQRRERVRSAIDRARAALGRDEPEPAMREADAALAIDPTSAEALEVRQQAAARLDAQRSERDAQALVARARALVQAGLDVAALRLLTTSTMRHPLVDREIAATQARVDEAPRMTRAQAVAGNDAPASGHARPEEPPTAVTAVKGASPAREPPVSSMPPTLIDALPVLSGKGYDLRRPDAERTEQDVAVASDRTVALRRRATRGLLVATVVVVALSLSGLLLMRSFETPSASDGLAVVRSIDRVAEPLERARRALGDARFAEAAAAFDEVLAIEPDHREASDGKARTSRMLEVGTLRSAARELARQGRRDEAVKKYQEALALNPQDAGIADELAKLQQPAPPPPAVEGGTRVASNGMSELLRSGERAMRNREYDVALRRFEAAQRMDPSNRHAIDGLRRATAAKTRADEALRALEGRAPTQVSEKPAPSVTRVERLMADGLKAMESEDYAAAQRAFEEVLRLEPQHARARALLRFLTGQGA